MESRIVHGLFFCGEMIDVDGMTGGYNLQAAFSTGYLAGESAAQIQKNYLSRGTCPGGRCSQYSQIYLQQA
jgi:succinate dehydrogenase/fumarate reductase flavoprotein subunit